MDGSIVTAIISLCVLISWPDLRIRPVPHLSKLSQGTVGGRRHPGWGAPQGLADLCDGVQQRVGLKVSHRMKRRVKKPAECWDALFAASWVGSPTPPRPPTPLGSSLGLSGDLSPSAPLRPVGTHSSITRTQSGCTGPSLSTASTWEGGEVLGRGLVQVEHSCF